jgi:hypothetical protein
VIGLSLFCALVIGAYRRLVTMAIRPGVPDMDRAMLTILGIAMVPHLLVNTPSIELVALVWLTIFGLLRLPSVDKRPAKRVQLRQRKS